MFSIRYHWVNKVVIMKMLRVLCMTDLIVILHPKQTRRVSTLDVRDSQCGGSRLGSGRRCLVGLDAYNTVVFCRAQNISGDGI